MKEQSIRAPFDAPDATFSEPYQFDWEVKRSQFLTFVARVSSAEKASRWIKALRQEHPQANHVCWAYIAGAPNTTERSMSDDGEPSGTAGRPMLNVLEHSGLGEIAVAVVRYFGGTKLGTGGLQRAYSQSVQQALQGLPKVPCVPQTQLRCQIPFEHEAHLRRMLASYVCDELLVDYSIPIASEHQPLIGNNGITVTWLVASVDALACSEQLTNVLSGKVVWY